MENITKEELLKTLGEKKLSVEELEKLVGGQGDSDYRFCVATCMGKDNFDACMVKCLGY